MPRSGEVMNNPPPPPSLLLFVFLHSLAVSFYSRALGNDQKKKLRLATGVNIYFWLFHSLGLEQTETFLTTPYISLTQSLF